MLDTSALVALFDAHPHVTDEVAAADRGEVQLVMSAVAVADAESELRAGPSGWEYLLLTAGLRVMSLTEPVAIEVGGWPGPLAARHSAYEAQALRAVVVTTDPGAYKGLRVPLLVV